SRSSPAARSARDRSSPRPLARRGPPPTARGRGSAPMPRAARAPDRPSACARRCPPLHLARVERPGQVLGDLAEDPRLAPGLLALDRVPVLQDLARVLDLHV